jgi:hypothetical protein
MASHRVRELYHAGGCTVDRLSNRKSTEEGVDNLLSVLTRHNSCCSRRAAAVAGRTASPAGSDGHHEPRMSNSYVRTPSYVQVVQTAPNNRTCRKTHDSSDPQYPMSDCPMRIRYCAIVDNKKTGVGYVNKIKIPGSHWTSGRSDITPASVLRKIRVRFSSCAWTAWTYTSGVIV